MDMKAVAVAVICSTGSVSSVIGGVCEFTSSVVIVRCSPVPFRVEAQIQVQVSKLI